MRIPLDAISLLGKPAARTMRQPPYSPDTGSSVSTRASTKPTSATASDNGFLDTVQSQDHPAANLRIDDRLIELYTENCLAKVWSVGQKFLEKLPGQFPESVPATGENAGNYEAREARFWTCGFFPGSLYSLLERSTRFPKYMPTTHHVDRLKLHDQLLDLCRKWSEPLHVMANRQDTHDMGFIILPALRTDWELTGNKTSLESIVTAAHSLASRFDARVGAIRSWDKMQSTRYHVDDMENNFLIIIDSMCNLDLLFYAGHHTNNQQFIDMAAAHACIVLRNIVRDDFSTFHVCNLDPKTRKVRARQTHQGYSDDSTWSRGQAWAILGFTQTYMWTKDPEFLRAAISLSDYFLECLANSPHDYPYVPLWDFDAPGDGNTVPPRDTSAAMIAANGFLLLHQALHKSSRYLEAALRIAEEVIDLSLSPHRANLSLDTNGHILANSGGFDSILMNATANNNSFALKRYSDHGLVYADYYFLEFGNKLLRMGFI